MHTPGPKAANQPAGVNKCQCGVDLVWIERDFPELSFWHCPLHAAAPDLLEALEGLLAIGPKQKLPAFLDGSRASRNWQAFETGRAAVAKAKP